MKWIKARDYAVYANIAVKNVYEKIKKGLVQSKKIKGILHVAVDFLNALSLERYPTIVFFEFRFDIDC